MANEIPQKYSVGYGIGGSGVAVSEYGLNVRLGGRCVGGMRVASTGSAPIYVLVNARIIGANSVDDVNRIIPVITAAIGSVTERAYYWRKSFNVLGPLITYNSGAAGAFKGYASLNDPRGDNLGILGRTPISYLNNTKALRLSFGLSAGTDYCLSLNPSLDSTFVTSLLKTVAATDTLAIFPRGYNPNLTVGSIDPFFEFPILGIDSDNSLIINAGKYQSTGGVAGAPLKLPPFDEGTGYATALILRETASTSYDNRFYWFSPDSALTTGFPLNPGEYVDLTSDQEIPQIFGISAIAQTGQTGAISVLQTKF